MNKKRTNKNIANALGIIFLPIQCGFIMLKVMFPQGYFHTLRLATRQRDVRPIGYSVCKSHRLMSQDSVDG